MLVYGDLERVERSAVMRREIAETLLGCLRMSPGRQRHEALVNAFLATGELVQGLADREFAEKSVDDLSFVQEAGAKLLHAQAGAIMQSWRSGFAGELSLPRQWPNLLQELECAEPLRVKRGEGYAFYALYPESYIEAASRSGLSDRTVVIGLRSIGTGLAALVAAALDAGPAWSLRPSGHPFDRRPQIAPALASRILGEEDCDFAIVDEGPGLSGSSFGGVADWLLANGVAAGRIHFFPSHPDDPGPRASAAHRKFWREGNRHHVPMDALTIDTHEPAHRLSSWVADLVGAREKSWQDLSGGAWRALRHPDERFWPPSHMQMEKRKFLMRGEDGGNWLVKYAGLGGSSKEKMRRAALLHEAGFTSEMAGACHGFLVEKWVDGAPLNTIAMPRGQLIDHLGRYLGFRAQHLAPPGGGASLEELCRMAIFNTSEALGENAAKRLRQRIGPVGKFSRRLHRVDTDNRLHTWEWLMTGDGRLVKTDALDHNAAHDLVGCQDIAWDVAGAGIEFDLSGAERNRLAVIIGQQTDCDLREGVLAFFEVCYLAFQIGLWSGAFASAGGLDKARLEALVKRYAVRLRELLEIEDSQDEVDFPMQAGMPGFPG